MTRTTRYTSTAVAFFALALMIATAVVSSPQVFADSSGDNPWLSRRVIGIAHAGGENEHPHSTFFAFDQSLAKGGGHARP